MAVIAGIVAVTGMVTGLFTVDARYFKAKEGVELARNFQVYKMEQEATAIQNRIWALEDRYRGRQLPRNVYEEIRRLKARLAYLRKIINKYYGR